jgi:hypothetical protein
VPGSIYQAPALISALPVGVADDEVGVGLAELAKHEARIRQERRGSLQISETGTMNPPQSAAHLYFLKVTGPILNGLRLRSIKEPLHSQILPGGSAENKAELHCARSCLILMRSSSENMSG